MSRISVTRLSENISSKTSALVHWLARRLKARRVRVIGWSEGKCIFEILSGVRG